VTLTGPAIWIDATMGDRERRVFGMTLLERLLRGLRDAGIAPARIELALPEGAPDPALPADLADALPLHTTRGAAPAGERLQRACEAAGDRAVLALSADVVIDPRLVAHLARAVSHLAFLEPGAGRGAVLRLGAGAFGPDPDARSVREIAERALARGDVKPFAPEEFDAYIQKLRRELPPYLLGVVDPEAVTRVERFLFWSNYKGSTDFMTRYVYPPLVWRLVRPLARMRVHPNWITGLDWLAALGAIPLFAAGEWVPGLALAYLMSVMDSVDGKLARLTYKSSWLGNLLDHGLDIVHPPLWYLAWGWALGGGDASSAPFQASLAMLGLYALDRVVTFVFKRRTRVSIHGATPLDVRVRTFISRRNVNLPFFTAALVFDAWAGTPASVATGVFYAIVAWQALSLAWHAQRLVIFFGTRLR
jgi:phosphatidylglycerophosphate synthase